MADARYFTTVDGQPVRLFNCYNTREGFTGTIENNKKYNSLAPRLLVDRTIYRKAAPSNHECGPKCRNAKGHNCECSCGGKFHGAGG